MMLYEEGRFDLNDDVGQWIDELKEPRVWAGGTAAKPITVPAIEPVRVHHLLSQMSGLTYGFHYAHPTDEIYRDKGYDFGFASWRRSRPGRPRLVFEPAACSSPGAVGTTRSRSTCSGGSSRSGVARVSSRSSRTGYSDRWR